VSVDVVTCVRDRPGAVGLWLRSYMDQTLQPRVFVADSSTTREARRANLRACTAAGATHVHVRWPEWNKPVSLNTGAAAGSGDYLLFTDVDCLPCQDMLERGVSLSEQQPSVVTCRVWSLPQAAVDPQEDLRAQWPSFAARATPRSLYARGGFLLVPRGTHMEIGGHDEEFRGMGAMDEDYFTRCRWAGLTHTPLREATFYHVNHPPNQGVMTELGRQNIQAAKARNKKYFLSKCKKRGPMVANGGVPTNAAHRRNDAVGTRRRR
jgi:hypothetical protein